MSTLSFWYAHDQGGDHLATTPDEIDAALDRVDGLSDDYGDVATVVRAGDEGPALFMGLKGHVGALQYIEPGAGYFSKGDGSSDGEPLKYDWQSNIFGYPPNAKVPVAVVRAAVHEFARTGARPTGIEWQAWEPPLEAGDGSSPLAGRRSCLGVTAPERPGEAPGRSSGTRVRWRGGSCGWPGAWSPR